MTDLNKLQLVHALAETAYMKAVGEAPSVRARSPECQYHLDRLCDAMQMASREVRRVRMAEFYERQAEVKLEVRRDFPNVNWKDAVIQRIYEDE